MMRRLLASVLVVSMLSGCVFGSRKARLIESGATIGAGLAGAAALVTLHHCNDRNEDCALTGIFATSIAVGLGGLGFLGIFAAAANIPPVPTEWEEHEPELVREADAAARAGRCEASNAIARAVYAEHEDYYRRDFLPNAAIVRCLQAGWATQPHAAVTP